MYGARLLVQKGHHFLPVTMVLPPRHDEHTPEIEELVVPQVTDSATVSALDVVRNDLRGLRWKTGKE